MLFHFNYLISDNSLFILDTLLNCLELRIVSEFIKTGE
jgi:hypothetical protein